MGRVYFIVKTFKENKLSYFFYDRKWYEDYILNNSVNKVNYILKHGKKDVLFGFEVYKLDWVDVKTLKGVF